MAKRFPLRTGFILADAIPQRDQARIWSSIGQAIGTEPRETRTITGASGLQHPVQAISVDDKHGRVVIISSEPNPRTAALMQVDVQSVMPDSKVLVARPVVFDLGVIARKVFPNEQAARFDLNAFNATVKRIEGLKEANKKSYYDKQLGSIIAPAMRAFSNVALPALTQIVDVIQQGAYLDWKAMFEEAQHDPQNPAFSLAKLFEIDNLAVDRKCGICPIPLFDFTEEDFELFARGTDIEAVKERLKELGVYQFFFPSADQLTLGVVEKGLHDANQIVSTVERAPALGHLLGPNELTHNPRSITEMIAQLKEQGLLAEGEFGIEDTPEGRKVRSTIKFKPQESVFQRILNRISISISLKDLFPRP